METFGKRLQILRKKSCKSQKAIEAETGIPQRTLSDWESGRFEPRVSEVLKLAPALGVSITELFTELQQPDERRHHNVTTKRSRAAGKSQV